MSKQYIVESVKLKPGKSQSFLLHELEEWKLLNKKFNDTL